MLDKTWEQVNQAVDERARDCVARKKEPKDEIKDRMEGKGCLKGYVRSKGKKVKLICRKIYKGETGRAKRCINQSKKQEKEQFKRKRSEDVNKNMKLFWREVCK